jgi:hypothetical protein
MMVSGSRLWDKEDLEAVEWGYSGPALSAKSSSTRKSLKKLDIVKGFGRYHNSCERWFELTELQNLTWTARDSQPVTRA